MTVAANELRASTNRRYGVAPPMLRIISVDRPDVPAHTMPDRFRHDVTYFMTPGGDTGVPLPKGEFFIRRADAERWLADGVLRLVSPLDSTKSAEVEISEEQETWLEWLLANQIQHIRLESAS
jgi:hypothetical protein